MRLKIALRLWFPNIKVDSLETLRPSVCVYICLQRFIKNNEERAGENKRKEAGEKRKGKVERAQRCSRGKKKRVRWKIDADETALATYCDFTQNHLGYFNHFTRCPFSTTSSLTDTYSSKWKKKNAQKISNLEPWTRRYPVSLIQN